MTLFDGDGDLDLVLGSALNLLSCFSNVGTSTDPRFEVRSGTGNPFTGLDVSAAPRPTVGDVDGDGDMGLIVGNRDGTLRTLINNDAPTLTNGLRLTLSKIDEDTAASTTLRVSDLLPSIAAWGDVDAGALKGWAVVRTSANGTWQYSLNGSTWTPVGAVSESAALLLGGETSMRFVPDGQNGETALLTFRAWDQSSGSASTDAARSTADAIGVRRRGAGCQRLHRATEGMLYHDADGAGAIGRVQFARVSLFAGVVDASDFGVGVFAG